MSFTYEFVTREKNRLTHDKKHWYPRLPTHYSIHLSPYCPGLMLIWLNLFATYKHQNTTKGESCAYFLGVYHVRCHMGISFHRPFIPVYPGKHQGKHQRWMIGLSSWNPVFKVQKYRKCALSCHHHYLTNNMRPPTFGIRQPWMIWTFVGFCRLFL